MPTCGAFPDRSEADLLVVKSGQHDNWEVRGVSAQGAERLNPLAIREREIQENRAYPRGGGAFDPASQPIDPLQSEGYVGNFGEHLPDQAGITRVIFDQQDGLRHESPRSPHFLSRESGVTRRRNGNRRPAR